MTAVLLVFLSGGLTILTLRQRQATVWTSMPAVSPEVTEQRLYQSIRQSGEVQEHVFSIEFLDRGAQAYSLTFG